MSGVTFNLNVKYQFDSQPAAIVGTTGYGSTVLADPPFGTRYIILTIYVASNNLEIISVPFYAGYFSVFFFYPIGNNQLALDGWFKTDPFGASLVVLNLYQFTNSTTSNYQELSISNLPTLANGQSSITLDGNNPIQTVAFSPTADVTETAAFTSGRFDLCTSASIDASCVHFTPGPAGSLSPQEDVWVVLLPVPPLAFIVYTPSPIVTPAFFNRQYDISSNLGHANASQLVYESLGQYYSPADLAQFQSENSIPVHGVTYDVNGFASDIACEISPGNCGEANLDVQLITAISQYPSPTTYYYETGNNFLLQWILAMAEQAHPPLVQSVSYGEPDSDVPASYFLSFNIEAVKVRARTVTYIIHSTNAYC